MPSPSKRRNISKSTTRAALCKAAYLCATGSVLFSVLLSQSAVSLAMALSAILWHEGGHLLLFLLTGNGVPAFVLRGNGFRLLPAGAMSPRAEAAVAAAGPGCNLLFGWLLYRFVGSAAAKQLAVMHFITGLFNLLPIGTSDGGRLLFLFLHAFLPGSTARRLTDAVGALTAAFFFFYAVILYYFTGEGLCGILFVIFLVTERATCVQTVSEETGGKRRKQE